MPAITKNKTMWEDRAGTTYLLHLTNTSDGAIIILTHMGEYQYQDKLMWLHSKMGVEL